MDTTLRRLPLPRTSSVWRTTSTNLPSCRIRHHNTDNPHCHIVYNRINNEGKLISDRNDYRRNEQVTKTLKSKYGLTYGTDKSNTNTCKLRNAERTKYEILNAVKSALRMADSWDEFKSELAKRGVHLKLVYKDKEQSSRHPFLQGWI